MTLDEEKVLKKLKNEHTKESIILLDYIDKRNNIINYLINRINHLENKPEEIPYTPFEKELIIPHWLRDSNNL